MNAGELKNQLAGVPDDTPVVMSKDGEGNGFSPLAGIDVDSHYEATSTWSGEVIHPDDYNSEDYPQATACVCLWPVN